jgi:hypothetical protein
MTVYIPNDSNDRKLYQHFTFLGHTKIPKLGFFGMKI